MKDRSARKHRAHTPLPPRLPPPAPRRRINGDPLERAPWPHTCAGQSVPAKGRRKLPIGRATETPALATAGGGGSCGATVCTTVPGLLTTGSCTFLRPILFYFPTFSETLLDKCEISVELFKTYENT